MMKLIFFEILHEDALPAMRSVIRDALARPPKAITPFERITADDRTVEYIMEPGAATLAYVYRKVAGNFYDMVGMRIEQICGPAYRTQQFVAACAKTINTALNLGLSDAQLAAYAVDDTGLPADFRRQIEAQMAADPTLMRPLKTDGTPL